MFINFCEFWFTVRVFVNVYQFFVSVFLFFFLCNFEGRVELVPDHCHSFYFVRPEMQT